MPDCLALPFPIPPHPSTHTTPFRSSTHVPANTGGRHPPLLPRAAPCLGAGPRLALRGHGGQRRRHHPARLAGGDQGLASAPCVACCLFLYIMFIDVYMYRWRMLLLLLLLLLLLQTPACRRPISDRSTPDPHPKVVHPIRHTQSRRPPPRARPPRGASSSCPSTRSRRSSRCVCFALLCVALHWRVMSCIGVLVGCISSIV